MNTEFQNKTFVEILEILDPSSSRELCRIISEKTGRTLATIWNWKKGNTQPQSYSEKKVIMYAINRYLDTRTNASSLFPPLLKNSHEKGFVKIVR